MVDSTILVEKKYWMLSDEELEIIKGTPQWVMVLNHLYKYGSITGNEAKEYYGISRLPARIHEIVHVHKIPINIKVEPITQKNRFGKYTTFAKYSLEE